MTHDTKVIFCTTELSRNRITNHHFHVENEKVESGIGYDMVIGRNLLVQLGLNADFKYQVLQWDVATVPMKDPSGLLGKTDLNKREM